MPKFVLIVDLTIAPEGVDRFMEAVAVQVERSVRDEPGCCRFDVVRSADDPCKFTHYEIFEDAAAFEAHTRMPHTAAFAEIITPLIIEQAMRNGQLLVSETA